MDVIHQNISHADPCVPEQAQQKQEGTNAHPLIAKQSLPCCLIYMWAHQQDSDQARDNGCRRTGGAGRTTVTVSVPPSAADWKKETEVAHGLAANSIPCPGCKGRTVSRGRTAVHRLCDAGSKSPLAEAA